MKTSISNHEDSISKANTYTDTHFISNRNSFNVMKEDVDGNIGSRVKIHEITSDVTQDIRAEEFHLETFINENYHLPEIPGDDAIEKTSFILAEMNNSLFQKIIYKIEFMKEKNITIKITKFENN